MTTPEQNALARQGSAKRELKDWLQSDTFKGELRSLLPKGMTAERFVRVAFQAVHKNPKLLKCSQESFFNCLLSLGAIGLEPDGRNAHLIPFGAECTLVIDYKGIAQTLRRNHDVTSLHCDVVYTRDEYEAEQGTNQHLRHVKAKGDRGEPILAYSFVRLPDGSQEFEEMSIPEIDRIRKRSKTPDSGPWVTDWDAMARKTVFRKHAKMLPLSPESRDVLEADQDGDAIAFAQATPVAAAVVAGPALPAKRRGRPPTRVTQDDMGGNLPGDWQVPGPASSAPQMPPEPPEPPGNVAIAAAAENVPDDLLEPPEPTLDEIVLAKVQEAGFTEAELLALLKEVRWADADMTNLRQVAQKRPQGLGEVLKHWEDATLRLTEKRAKGAK